jgi:hypothetical protein
MICDRQTDIRMRNLRQKADWGKKTKTYSSTRFPRASCFEKKRDACPKYGGCTYDIVPWSPKGMRNRNKKLDSRAAKKSAKKLESSDCAKIL